MNMIENRLALHDELVELLGSDHVYFQPPENIKIQYPAIVYFRDDIDNIKADNSNYIRHIRYMVTIIDADPDSEFVEAMINHFVHCNWARHYISDNLNHDVFTLYY
jgi:hypothetical protein